MSEMFCVHSKPKSRGVFKFLRFEKRFRKAPFGDGLVWTVGLTVQIQLCFQIPLAWRGHFTLHSTHATCQENAGAANAFRYWNPHLVSHSAGKECKITEITLSYGRVSADMISPYPCDNSKEKAIVNEVTRKNHSSPGKEIVKILFPRLCEATSQASSILLHLTKTPTQNQSHPANKTKP